MPDMDQVNPNEAINEQRAALAALEQLLRDAETAHAAYERDLGHPDDNWPAFYARYLFDRLPFGPGYPERIEVTPEDLPSTEPYVSG